MIEDMDIVCKKCGKILGKVKEGKVVIQHRGRIVSFSAKNLINGLEITCEFCKTENQFKK